MGRRRERRTRSDVEDGFPTFEHNQWTFEGQVERWGAFSRGLSHAPRGRRVAARALAAMLLLPFVIGIVISIVRLLT